MSFYERVNERGIQMPINLICPMRVALLSIILLVAGCSGSSSGGSTTTNFNLDEGNVTTMLEGQTYELVPDGGASAGASVQSWRWSDRPIIEGALSQCEPVQDFDSPRAATRLEAACSVPAKCNLSFDQVSSTNVAGGGQSRFSVRVPVLKADVGVTYRLEAIDSAGQTSVANFTFCLLAINEAPFAQNDAFTVTEGIPLVVTGDSGINLLTNDSDDINVGNQPLSVSSTPVVAPRGATNFSLQSDGGFTYFYEGDATVAGGTQINDSFQYEITDGSFSSIGTVNLTIVATDNSPVLNEDLPAQSFVAGVPVEVDFAEYFSDPEGSDLFFSATGLPGGGDLALTPLGVLTGVPAPADTGEFEVVVEAADLQNSAVGLVTIVITGNLPPNANPVPTQVVAFGELLSLDMSAFFSDPEEGELIYSLSTVPATEIQINPDSGLMTGLITNAGDYEFTVSATDSTGGTVSAAFLVTQLEQPNRTPVFTGIINSQSVTIGNSINPVSGEFADPDQDTLTFSINSLPSGLSFNSNTGVLSGTPTQLGDSILVITATDPDDLSVSSNAFTVGVTEIPNEAPAFSGSIGNQSGNVGTAIASIQGNFSDADNDPLVYSSTTLPAGLVINSSTGVITGTPTEEGTTAVSITATDPGQASATSNAFDIVIAPQINNPPVVTNVTPSSSVTLEAEETQTVELTVTDEDTSSLVYSGVSNNPAIATVTGGTNGVFTINAVAAGTTTLSLNVTDDASQSALETVNVTVTAIPNEPPVINGRTPTADSLTLAPGNVRNVTLDVTDDDIDGVTYAAVSDDTGVATVSVTANNRIRIVAVADGSATITMTVTDAGGLTDDDTIDIDVETANTAPEITSRTPSAQTIAMLTTDTQAMTLAVSDESVATLSYAGTSDDTDVATVSVTANGNYTIVAQGVGSANLLLEVEDEEGLSDSIVVPVTVSLANQPPTITGRIPTTSPLLITSGESLEVTLTVTDESTATLTYSGDSEDNFVTVSGGANGEFTLLANAPGTTTVTLTVTDSEGLQDEEVITVTVAAADLPPAVTSRTPAADVTLDLNDVQPVSFVIDDEEPATVVITAESDDAAVASVTDNGDNTFTVTALGSGSATMTFTIADAGGQSVTDSMTVTVDAPPVVVTRDPAGDLTITDTEIVVVELTVTDEFPATLSYTARSSAPLFATASINASDEVVIRGVSAGDANIIVTVTDAGGQSVQTVIPVTVTDIAQPLADAGEAIRG